MSTDNDKPPTPRPPRTGAVSNLAKASCIAGLFGVACLVAAELQFVFLVGGFAIVSGHIARRRIRRNPKSTLGSGMALSGLILGYMCVCLTVLDFFERKKMLNQARVLATLAIAEPLELAANNFLTEYGTLPDVGDRVITNSSQGVQLLNILLGLEQVSSNSQNKHQIKFLSVREGKNRKNGLIYSQSGNSVEGLLDSWGNPYTVILDSDNDEILRFKIATKDIELKGRRVAVFTPGPDQKEGTGDDILTW